MAYPNLLTKLQPYPPAKVTFDRELSGNASLAKQAFMIDVDFLQKKSQRVVKTLKMLTVLEGPSQSHLSFGLQAFSAFQNCSFYQLVFCLFAVFVCVPRIHC